MDTHNAAEGRASVLFCYSFGKAQRILAGVDPAIGPIFCHGAVEPLNRAYAQAGVDLPPTRPVSDIAAKDKTAFKGALIIAPPSAQGSAWMRRFGDYSDAFASGWMRLRVVVRTTLRLGDAHTRRTFFGRYRRKRWRAWIP